MINPVGLWNPKNSRKYYLLSRCFTFHQQPVALLLKIRRIKFAIREQQNIQNAQRRLDGRKKNHQKQQFSGYKKPDEERTSSLFYFHIGSFFRKGKFKFLGFHHFRHI